MSFSLEPAPELQGELLDFARRRHLPPQRLLDQIVREWLARQDAPTAPPAEQAGPMLALFAEWDAEDAQMTPDEAAQERRLWEQFETNVNETRDALGMRRL